MNDTAPSVADSSAPISRAQWRVLIAAGLGWALDGLDIMLYAFALNAIRAEFALSGAQAGLLAAVTLVASAVGGAACGALADRYGRARMLIVSILVYSVFTGLTATAQSLGALILWRTLVGLGLGAEWTAGSVLVAETWPARHRGKAIGLMQSGWALGYIAAALLAGAIVPNYGWRPLFVLGVLPALLTLWIRRAVPEPAIWLERGGWAGSDRGRVGYSPSPPTPLPRGEGSVLAEERRGSNRVGVPLAWTFPLSAIFRAPHRRRTLLATAIATSLLFAYWGLFTWVPSFLASPIEKGGAGLTLVRSIGWIVPMQVGAFLGYILFGFFADRWGRRPTFVTFVLASAVLVPAYGLFARSPVALFVLGPLIGFFGHGYFSLFGAWLAELYPSHLRATAQGFCYNAGRAVSALAPVLIGALADRYGIGVALASTAGCYLVGAALIRLLPETRGEALS
jgi:MFS family permease